MLLHTFGLKFMHMLILHLMHVYILYRFPIKYQWKEIKDLVLQNDYKGMGISIEQNMMSTRMQKT